MQQHPSRRGFRSTFHFSKRDDAHFLREPLDVLKPNRVDLKGKKKKKKKSDPKSNPLSDNYVIRNVVVVQKNW